MGRPEGVVKFHFKLFHFFLAAHGHELQRNLAKVCQHRAFKLDMKTWFGTFCFLLRRTFALVFFFWGQKYPKKFFVVFFLKGDEK